MYILKWWYHPIIECLLIYNKILCILISFFLKGSLSSLSFYRQVLLLGWCKPIPYSTSHKTQTRSVPKTQDLWVSNSLYVLIQVMLFFLLAPNYPLLSCVRDQGDAITILNSYTDIHNKGVLKRDRAVPWRYTEWLSFM